MKASWETGDFFDMYGGITRRNPTCRVCGYAMPTIPYGADGEIRARYERDMVSHVMAYHGDEVKALMKRREEEEAQHESNGDGNDA
jgi:hypothetical protein